MLRSVARTTARTRQCFKIVSSLNWLRLKRTKTRPKLRTTRITLAREKTLKWWVPSNSAAPASTTLSMTTQLKTRKSLWTKWLQKDWIRGCRGTKIRPVPRRSWAAPARSRKFRQKLSYRWVTRVDWQTALTLGNKIKCQSRWLKSASLDLRIIHQMISKLQVHHSRPWRRKRTRHLPKNET